jgi:hypothetical protein
VDTESAYPDEAISTLLGIEALPEDIGHRLASTQGSSYRARCAALQAVIGVLPAEVRDSMSPEQLSVLALGGAAASEALRTG